MKNKKVIIIPIILVILAIGLSLVIFINKKDKNNHLSSNIEKKEEIVKLSVDFDIDKGVPTIEDFTDKEGIINLDGVPIEEINCEEEVDCVSKKIITKLGSYEITITIDNKEYKSVLNVVDKTAPIIKLKDVTIHENEEYTVDMFVEEKMDNFSKDIKIYFEKEEMANYKSVSEYLVKIVAEDESGNKTIDEAKLNIIKKDEKTPTSNSSSNNSGTTTTNKNQVTTSSTTKKTTTSNKITTSDNVVVQRALSKVGKTGMSCDSLVEYAINGIGKSLIEYEHESITTCRTSSGKAFNQNDPEMYSDHSYIVEAKVIIDGFTKYKYYTKDNIIYKEEGYRDGEWIDKSSTSMSVGDKAYKYCSTMNTDVPILVFNTNTVYKVSLDSLKPGDILKYADGGTGTGHVAIYIGDGQAVHGGMGSNQSVKVTSIYLPKATTPVGYRIK